MQPDTIRKTSHEKPSYQLMLSHWSHRPAKAVMFIYWIGHPPPRGRPTCPLKFVHNFAFVGDGAGGHDCDPADPFPPSPVFPHIPQYASESSLCYGGSLVFTNIIVATSMAPGPNFASTTAKQKTPQLILPRLKCWLFRKNLSWLFVNIFLTLSIFCVLGSVEGTAPLGPKCHHMDFEYV